MKRLGLMLALSALGGCTLEPHYARPTPAVPPRFPSGDAYLRQSEAALEAARIRLRPIVMTSLAFMFGVFPLVIASGAGARSRIEIGTAVIGGMLTATVLAIFYIPMFFVLVRKIFRKQSPTPEERAAADAQRHREIEAKRAAEDGQQPA